ncbi:MAG: polyprenyl synthetase family protein [Bacteroides sp.]|nr:polyprenyl synthetase family protein [Bacteroides sp.]
MTYTEKLAYYKNTVDSKLEEYLAFGTKKQDRLFDAMRYSLMAGGKRVRPILTLEFASVCGGSVEAALPAACAIEMIHTFSLIHDDLPCMDNDDMRRGRKSCHKEFDEATALLAGDALELYPFEVLTDSVKYGVSPENTVKMVKILAEYAGPTGMTGGQQIDTQFEGESIGEEALLEMYRLKTSRLLQAGACMGCISAGADADTVRKAFEYGERLGLAFQITDDILDVCGDPEVLGKPTGSDIENNKETYAGLVGLDKAREKAKKLTYEALDIIDGFAGSGFLRELTLELLKRNK